MKISTVYTLFLISLYFRSLSCIENFTELRIGGLFPYGRSWPVGQFLLPAFEMAIEDVNKDPELLPGIKITSFVADSQCDSSVG